MILLRLFSRNISRGCSLLGMKSAELGTTSRLLLKNSEIQLQNRTYGAYEGDGKTVGFVINKKNADVLLINNAMSGGFVMASGAELMGSMVLFPHSVLSWHVTVAEDVTEEALVLFKLLEPKLDILVFGYGIRRDYTPEVRERFTKACRKLGLRFEALPTSQAIGLYNFLAEERRFVAAALIPPAEVDIFRWDRSKDDSIESGLEEVEALSGDKEDKKLLP